MYKLTFKKRTWIVKQHLKGISTSKICLAQNISRMTVSNLVKSYKKYGWNCLKDHKTGRAEIRLNLDQPKFQSLTVKTSSIVPTSPLSRSISATVSC